MATPPRFPPPQHGARPETYVLGNRLAASAQLLDAELSQLTSFSVKILKFSGIVLTVTSIVLLISFSQQQSIPAPITALSSIFLLLFSGIVSLIYATLVLSVVYPPLLIAADPQLKDISSHYPLFREKVHSSSTAIWLKRNLEHPYSRCPRRLLFNLKRMQRRLKRQKKYINMTILAGCTVIILIPYTAIISILTQDQEFFNGLLIGSFIGSIIIHLIVVWKRSTSRYIVTVFPTIVFANILLFISFFVLFILLSRGSVQYAQFNDYVLAAFCYFVILLSIGIVCRLGIPGALLWGAMLFVFFVFVIGLGKSAAAALRIMNLGGDVQAQFIVKPEACGMLKNNEIIKDHHAGPDGKVVSCIQRMCV